MKEFSSRESKLIIGGIIIGLMIAIFAACMNGCSEEYAAKHNIEAVE